jgi:hypothetical protein
VTKPRLNFSLLGEDDVQCSVILIGGWSVRSIVELK